MKNHYRLLLIQNSDYPDHPWPHRLEYQWQNLERIWESLDGLECDDLQDGIRELGRTWPRLELLDVVEERS